MDNAIWYILAAIILGTASITSESFLGSLFLTIGVIAMLEVFT